MRMCRAIDPGNNLRCMLFPDEYHELFIDAESFQHLVLDMNELTPGDHIRFRDDECWTMGWIQRRTEKSLWIKVTAEHDRGERKRTLFRNIGDVFRVPMLPEDTTETVYWRQS